MMNTYDIGNREKRRALVIGGSIGGLLTARVLADFYEEVLVIDKDEFPGEPADRSGTPQGYHPHRFTPRGKTIVERFFPGYEEDLLKLGALSSLNKTVTNMNEFGTISGPYQRNDLKFSRALLEWVIRERVKRIPQVSFLPGHEAVQLMSTPDRNKVTGAVIRGRSSGGEETPYEADLVVDTGGRLSKLTKWLEFMGLEVPASDYLNVELGYSTRRYRVPAAKEHLVKEWDVINIAGQPAAGTFTGVLSFIENNVAEMLLYRPGGQYPPTKEDEYEKAAANLPDPVIGEILGELEPAAPPRGFRVPQLYRRHYEQMTDWPAGLLVFGDAYCIYDPIFGQGMTVAAIEAETLEACLRKQSLAPVPSPAFERSVLRGLQDVIEPAWWLNCAADLRWEGVTYSGAAPLKGIEFGRKYMSLVLKYATAEKNMKFFGLYWAVNTLTLPPGQLFHPDIVREVLSSSEEGRRLLDELLAEGSGSLDAVLEEIVPAFSETAYETV
ncbi:NAD(P)/FAD-dependent oxidoreductase [Paenibacillus chitinolyticus]|uniref:NAD(P)/FAD-dependent oxidoreductase n=1 Tax=Paenibacillus chitinolyticus TaxID=79263 RepID=UPI0035E11954